MAKYFIFSTIILVNCVLNGFFCVKLNHESARLFGKAHTKTVKETKVVTSLVLSSCVQVDATLPPCRNVRYLRFPHFETFPFYNNFNNDNSMFLKTESSGVQTTPLGWAEYLGIYAPTVTITHTEIHTSTVQDPNVMVTFAVKGCKPIKLPLDLNKCPEDSVPPVPVEEIIATSTVVTKINPTSVLETSTIGSQISTSNHKKSSEIYLNNGNNFLDDQVTPESFNSGVDLLVQASTENNFVEVPENREPTEILPN